MTPVAHKQKHLHDNPLAVQVLVPVSKAQQTSGPREHTATDASDPDACGSSTLRQLLPTS